MGKVDYINDDGARVARTWTDLDEEGQPKTDEAIWVMRREEGNGGLPVWPPRCSPARSRCC